MGCERGYGIIPPCRTDEGNITGDVIVSGIFAKTVADLHSVMDAVFPLVPDEKIQEKRVSLSPAESLTVGVWKSFSGVPLDERIRDSMEALPRRLESTQVSDDGPRLAARLSPGPSLGLARVHKALEAFTLDLSIGNKQTLNEATSAQKEGGDMIEVFLSKSEFSAPFTPVCAILPHEHNYDHRHFHVIGEKVPYWRALTGYVAPFSVTGNPVVTMPLCTIDGKPRGIQVVGRRQQDEELLTVSALLERQLGPIPNLLQYSQAAHSFDKAQLERDCGRGRRSHGRDAGGSAGG